MPGDRKADCRNCRAQCTADESIAVESLIVIRSCVWLAQKSDSRQADPLV
jgi:hypothetical protein